MLNGDVLTDLDVTAQLALHEQRGARATLALTPVEDPSAYGLVRTRDDGEVTGFVEKPAPDQIDTRNISAGIYVLERAVLELLRPGEPASIERDVFPRLVGEGLFAYVGEGYWLDIGTPERYLEGTFDILEGTVAPRGGAHGRRLPGVERRRERRPRRSRRRSSRRLPDRRRRADRRPRGARAAASRVGARHDDRAARSSCAARGSAPTARCAAASSAGGVRIGDGTRVEGLAVLGEGVTIGAGNVVTNGARLFPGVTIPDGGISF